MGLLSRIPRVKLVRQERQDPALTWADYQNYFTFQNLLYGPPLTQTLGGRETERIDGTFRAFVEQGYRRNPIIFTCITVRALVFSEARFQWQRMRAGKPGDLFGTQELAILERPWPNATTRNLLARMEQDASIAGNAYIARRGRQIRRLRPDWTAIVLGSFEADADPDDPFIELAGYLYYPGGFHSGKRPVPFLVDEVAHYAPGTPDPMAHFRGQSWLTPVIGEITADSAATEHKGSYFTNAATSNAIVTFAQNNPDDIKAWVQHFRDNYEGAANAYKTVFLGGGADMKVIGANMRQAAFKEAVGSGETRISAAAGLPPVIAGFSEGLEAATYSNYHLAKRRFADGTLSPLWGFAAGALESIVNVPSDARLWYDVEGIPFLQDDALDAANIIKVQAETIGRLTDSGFDGESAKAAVVAGDLSLAKHTGMPSVQVQPASNGGPPEDAPVPSDGGAAD